MKTFPMFIRTTGRQVVIVGGAEQAAQKMRLLLTVGGHGRRAVHAVHADPDAGPEAPVMAICKERDFGI